MPGRKITSNLHLLRDILDYIERTNETCILLSLDEEKAFGRVNRTFLLNLLNRFGFGSSFFPELARYIMVLTCKSSLMNG